MSSELYVTPQETQNTSFMSRVRAVTRKCSFCNCEGHNITSCNNESLRMFLEYLVHLKNETLSINDENRILAIPHIEQYIYNFCSQSESNTKLIKSLACRFCGARLRSTLQVSINKIIMYLFAIDYMTLSLNEYNYIPFGEETPVRVSNIIDGILLNYMANNATSRSNIDLDDLKNKVIYNLELCILCDNGDAQTACLETDLECAICYNSMKKNLVAKLECQHEFCVNCTKNLIQKKYTNCPYCRSEIEKITCYDKKWYDKLKKCSEM